MSMGKDEEANERLLDLNTQEKSGRSSRRSYRFKNHARRLFKLPVSIFI